MQTKRSIVLLLVTLLAIAAAVAGIVRHRHRAERAARNVVALTFDDGPDPDSTPRVLDILKAHHARATFFVVGEFVAKHPDLTRRVISEGHELGLHGMRHQMMTRMSQEDAWSDVNELKALLTNTVDACRVTHFRFPFGDVNDYVKSMVVSQGMAVAGWDVDTLDWLDRTPPSAIAERVGHAPRGSVVLLHDGLDATYRLGRRHDPGIATNRAATWAGLEQGLDELDRRGMRSVTMQERERVPGVAPSASFRHGY